MGGFDFGKRCKICGRVEAAFRPNSFKDQICPECQFKNLSRGTLKGL